MENSELRISFGRFAKEYQQYRRSYEPEIYDLLFSLIPTKNPTILDIGCGTGKSTEPLLLFSNKGVKAIGIDPDPAMLDEARLSAKEKNLDIEYIVADAENIPFKENTFDAIISGAAFHWYGNVPTITKIKNTLKEGGFFFVFWNQYIKVKDKPVIGAGIFGKYKWKGIPKEYREMDFVSNLLTESGLKNVTQKTFSRLERKTIDDVMNGFKTNSSYSLFTEEQRAAFIKDMTEAYTIALAGKEYDENELETRICYGFK